MLTNYAFSLQKSSVDSLRFKGEVALSVIFDNLCQRVKNKELNRYDPEVNALLKLYESHQYRCKERPSEFLKLAYNICSNQFPHIFDRLKVNPFFIPCIVLFVVLFAFIIANFSGWIKWKYRRPINKLVVATVILIIVLFILFKLTCHRYVTSDSFYGIRF